MKYGKLLQKCVTFIVNYLKGFLKEQLTFS